MSPVIPHIASECINQIQNKDETNWPNIDKKFLEKKKLQIVVQLNGKKRGLITCDANTDEDQLLTLIKSDGQYKKFFKDMKIIKTIYVKDRLVNLILK